jgi:phospholipid/cholesterol/gamma-HCH transport system substrate-binding protein
VQNISRSLDNLATASDGLKDVPKVLAAVRTALSPENLDRLRLLLAHLEQTAGAAAPLTEEARALVVTLSGLARRVESDTLPRTQTLIVEVTAATRRLDRLLDTLNESPQAVIFGAAPARPGPGESGFSPPPAPALH